MILKIALMGLLVLFPLGVVEAGPLCSGSGATCVDAHREPGAMCYTVRVDAPGGVSTGTAGCALFVDANCRPSDHKPYWDCETGLAP